MKKLNVVTALFSAVLFLSSISVVGCKHNSKTPASDPAPTLQLISATGSKVYFVGDTVENEDFTVTAKYSDNSKKTLADEDFTIQVAAANLDAEQKLIRSEDSTGHEEEVTVKVSYEDKSCNKTILLRDKPVSISVTPSSDFPTEYFDGEEIDLSKIKVEVEYAGTSEKEEVSDGVEYKLNPTEDAEKVELVITYGDFESDPILITVKKYDGGLVTRADVSGTNTTDDDYTGSLYRGFTFTTAKDYGEVDNQWGTITQIETNADLKAGKYYKVSLTLTSQIPNQSTVVNLAKDVGEGNEIYIKRFTTDARDNQLELFYSPEEDVENVWIIIGHGWTAPNNTFTIKNIKIVEDDISTATVEEMKLTSTYDTFGSEASAKFTTTVKGYNVKPEYTVVSETGSTGSAVEEDGTFTFGEFTSGSTTSDVTVKASFNGLELTKTVTVNFIKAFDEDSYEWSEEIDVNSGWIYEETKGNIGVYSSVGATAVFADDGTAVKFTNTNPGSVWTSEWNTQIAVGAFDVNAGDTYKISFKAFFDSTDGNINDGSSEAVVPSFTDIKEYTKEVVAKPNQYKENKAEAIITFGMGYAGVTNTVTIYDVKVEKTKSFEVTGITVSPDENVSLKKDKKQQFTANDTTLNLPRNVEWSVSPETAGTISDSGLFTAGEVEEDTVVTVTAKYSETVSASAQITVLAPVAGGVVPYTITVEKIAGAGGEFIFNWSDDSYALPLSTDAIVTFQLGSNKKETQPWAKVEGEGLRAYMSTVGADWSQPGEKDFYVRVKATSGKMYDITGILTVTGAAGEVSEIEVKVVENITLSETKVSFDNASADAVEVTITAEGFTPDAYTAESNDESVAAVSVSGNKVTITPVADGDAVVTVTANGKTAEIKVHVGEIVKLYIFDNDGTKQITNINPGWGQAGSCSVVDLVDKDGYTGKAAYIVNLNYQGWDLNNVEATEYTGIHIKYYTEDSTSLNIYPINTKKASGPKEYEIKNPSIKKNTWTEADYVFDTSNEANAEIVACLDQIKFDGNGNIYISELYLYK